MILRPPLLRCGQTEIFTPWPVLRWADEKKSGKKKPVFFRKLHEARRHRLKPPDSAAEDPDRLPDGPGTVPGMPVKKPVHEGAQGKAYGGHGDDDHGVHAEIRAGGRISPAQLRHHPVQPEAGHDRNDGRHQEDGIDHPHSAGQEMTQQ